MKPLKLTLMWHVPVRLTSVSETVKSKCSLGSIQPKTDRAIFIFQPKTTHYK